MDANKIRRLRAALEETTTEFGARFMASRRTVEDWEQGRHTPTGPKLAAMETLARTVNKARRTA